MKTSISKPFFLFVAILSYSFVFAQIESKKINQHDFEFKYTQTDTSFLKTVVVYQNNKKVLEHTLYNEDGDCSSIQKEVGTYEINNNQLIFYTYWVAADRQAILIYPYGFRKQTYTVENSGEITLTNAEIYLEDFNDYGIDDFKKNPRTIIEKKQLKQYVNEIETTYQAHFVMDEKKKILQHEVRKKLAKELQTETQDWQEIYGHTNSE